MHGLEGLTYAASVNLSENLVLASLDGLNNLTQVESGLHLSALASLRDVSALSALSEVGYLDVGSCPLLTDLGGLSGVASLGSLYLMYNGVLASVDGLQGIQELSGVTIVNNAALTSLRGLVGVSDVTGQFVIEDNVTPPTCEAEWFRARSNPDNPSFVPTITGNDDAGTCEP